jgi:hypothetical protein
VFQRLITSSKVHFHYHGGGAEWTDFRENLRPGAEPKPGSRPGEWPKDTGPHRSDNVVDAEFETIEPEDDDTDGTPAQRVDDKDSDRNKHSPWRKK